MNKFLSKRESDRSLARKRVEIESSITAQRIRKTVIDRDSISFSSFYFYVDRPIDIQDTEKHTGRSYIKRKRKSISSSTSFLLYGPDYLSFYLLGHEEKKKKKCTLSPLANT